VARPLGPTYRSAALVGGPGGKAPRVFLPAAPRLPNGPRLTQEGA